MALTVTAFSIQLLPHAAPLPPLPSPSSSWSERCSSRDARCLLPSLGHSEKLDQGGKDKDCKDVPSPAVEMTAHSWCLGRDPGLDALRAGGIQGGIPPWYPLNDLSPSTSVPQLNFQADQDGEK